MMVLFTLILNLVFFSCFSHYINVEGDEIYWQNQSISSYIVIAPKVVRPGTLYGVMVLWLSKRNENLSTISVQAAISKGGAEVVMAETTIALKQVETMFLKIPLSCEPGLYKLRVEGNYPGSVGGNIFVNETELLYSSRFLAIVVQTSQPVYNAGQEVYFRVILLTTEMKPYEDTVNVYILDTDGIIVRRWLSMQLNNGVVSHKFTLPSLAKTGFWKIKVEAGYQVEEHLIRVETYFQPLFEVHVIMAAYLLNTEETIQATIYARSEVQRIARGNATFTLFGKFYRQNSSFIYICDEQVFMNNGQYDLSIPMRYVKTTMGSLTEVELRLEATLTESLYGVTVSGYSHTRIVKQSVEIKFLGPSPKIFKPGMPLEGQVVVMYSDMQRLSEETLFTSTVKVQGFVDLKDGGRVSMLAASYDSNEVFEDIIFENGSDITLLSFASVENYRTYGVLNFILDVPRDAESVTLAALYEDEEGTTATTKIVAVKMISYYKRYINVRTSTQDARTGEYAIFHIKSNFQMLDYYFMILSKGLLLFAGVKNVETDVGTMSTLAVAVAPNMAPGFTLLVFHVTEQSEIISDKIFLPVNGFKGYECTLELNQGKDHTKRTVEAIMPADAGAFMGITAQRSAAYFMQAGNTVTKSRIAESYFQFDHHQKVDSKVTWKSREGLLPDDSVYYTSMNDGIDGRETFELADVVILTSARMSETIRNDQCQVERGYKSCATGGCYMVSQQCDGHKDCSDGSDENYCNIQDRELKYRILRRSISSEIFDEISDNWSWQEMNGEYGGEEFFRMVVPPVSDRWYFTAFSVSKELGFTTIEEPIEFHSMKPFTMHLKGPSICHHGEQIALQALLLNNEPYEMIIFLLLHGSEDYKFVHVEENGVVSSYGARLSTGDHQHIVYLEPGTQQEVNIPIAPTIDQGDILVRVSALTQVAQSDHEHKLTVLPEGGLINKHTSVFLNLKNRALILKYLDIIVEESPIVPYQNWRRYVYGSPKGTVSLTSDIIGPAFLEIPLTTNVMLNRAMKGTEARIFELASNVWTLHYLRLTNQLEQSVLRNVMEEVNILYAQVMKRYDKKGSFRNWDTSESSVWLTAWVIRILQQASFPEWEDYFYVEPPVFTKTVTWLLKFQTKLGSFIESSANQKSSDIHTRSVVVLTAHVLITIQEVLHSVQGETRTLAAIASQTAVRFLENMIPSLTDSYEIAIVTYALTLSGSSKKAIAFQLLHAKRRKEGDYLYWSEKVITSNEVKYENQRPFIRHREYQDTDSLAVEGTSLALMVYLIRDGVTMLTEQIVEWLTSVRMNTNGFISTIDTVTALQALTEYAFRARLADITNMSITMESPSSSGYRTTLRVDKRKISISHTFEIPNVWGHINIIGRGSGQAIVQMDISYGIDYQPLTETPPVETFQLEIMEYYSAFRNKSAVTIQCCLRWTQSNPAISGPSILEIELPTGYHITETEAEMVVKAQVYPSLRDARITQGKSIWFFDYVDQNLKCFNHTVTRWYPTANMTLYRQAFLYEIHAREHFVQTLFNSTSLYILSICEVCGSYQCPYCPYYSHADRNMKYSLKVHVVLVLALWCPIHKYETLF